MEPTINSFRLCLSFGQNQGEQEGHNRHILGRTRSHYNTKKPSAAILKNMAVALYFKRQHPK